MCTAGPVPDLDVDEVSVGPMMTGTVPISWAPPEVQAAHEARLRAAITASSLHSACPVLQGQGPSRRVVAQPYRAPHGPGLS